MHYDGEQFSRTLDFVHYFKTSAKTGDGIKEAIEFMLKKVCSDEQLAKYGSMVLRISHFEPAGQVA